MKAMTIEAYNEAVKAINLIAKKELYILAKKYIDSNNPYKIGDIVTDHIGSIIVEHINYRMTDYDNPYAVYYGIELRKDLQPKKNGSKRNSFQMNLIK